jgi:hypothetical protein
LTVNLTCNIISWLLLLFFYEQIKMSKKRGGGGGGGGGVLEKDRAVDGKVLGKKY